MQANLYYNCNMDPEIELLTNEELKKEINTLQRDIANYEVQIKDYQQIVRELSKRLEEENKTL